MDIDPVATLRCWSIDVDLAGHTYTIPALPASTWLLAVLDSGWLDIVPGLFVDAAELDDQLLDGTIDYAEVKAAAQAALATAAGTRWWSARSLVRVITSTWIGGDLLLHGVDPDRVSLAAYLSAALRVAASNLDKADWQRFEMQLDMPPSGVSPEEWYDPEAAEQSFVALMAADGG